MADAQDAKIRVLIVDDSSFTRSSLLRMFEHTPDIRVIAVASDGEMALALVKELRPDVVTLDVQMPVMDGLTALGRIMAESPTPVIMLSCCTGKGGEQTMRALQLGAVDFVDKCSVGGPMEISALGRELTEKIRVAARVSPRPREISSAATPAFSRPRPIALGVGGAELVLVGTSTGGPAALSAVLVSLPEHFRCPILVVQHMPAGFTAALADRLNRICSIPVKEAEEGERLRGGCVYIAPAGRHLKVRRLGDELWVWLDLTPGDSLHRPSVDVLFRSAAAASGKGCLAFVLTGMGNDGAAGSLEIKREGGRVFVESERTAVVPGMPRAAAAAAPVDGTIPLFEVAETMLRLA